MVFPLALSPSDPPGLGPSDLLTAAMDPFHFHPPPSYAMLVGRSLLSINRQLAVVLSRSNPAPRARARPLSLPWLQITGACISMLNGVIENTPTKKQTKQGDGTYPKKPTRLREIHHTSIKNEDRVVPGHYNPS